MGITVCNPGPEHAHISAMTQYRLWMDKRISMASKRVRSHHQHLRYINGDHCLRPLA